MLGKCTLQFESNGSRGMNPRLLGSVKTKCLYLRYELASKLNFEDEIPLTGE